MTTRRRMQFATLVALALAVCAAAPAFAQARVTGTVTDMDGKPVKGVKIEMIPSDASKRTSSNTTDKKGRFVFGLLSKDEYRLLAWADGMRVAYIDAQIEKPDNPDVWSYDGAIPPGAEMPSFALDGLSSMTYDLKVEPYTGDPGKYGTGLPVDPVKSIIARFEAGEMDEALAEARTVAEKNPDNATAHYLYAYALVTTGDAESGEAEARRVLELDPVFEGAGTLLGRSLEAQGDLEGAVRAYESQAETATTDQVRHEAILAAAVAHEQLGNDAEAATMLEELREMSPDDAAVLKELAGLYIKLGEKDKAQALLEQVAELGDADPVVLYNLGAEKFNQGAFEEAADIFRRVIEVDPTLADAYRQLAFTLLNLNDQAGATDALGRYLEIAPEDAPATQTARAMYEQLKKATSAP